ncbi:peroxisomal membrane anchor protein [Mitosporidium daphniae]|uniref:Peroxisomal membrane protein PEX14 n=1 Tax=Mitosporidium daphniae TaxID=1485682 RepID=A0A098VMU0_9MICR|nr:peroxisomal membrane anchor protein [Mitosporidium daphniae]KGG50353.1 peroxisomal membrane anchor protein [Mitosporidium daphniae]|eukprot:XP_013236780.1 peroxisomal membrane anchor protein [Mitosporidium daphniae]
MDAKVKSSPLSKRITFLEGKGLTSEEVEEALKRAYPEQENPQDKNKVNSSEEQKIIAFPKEDVPQKQPKLPERVVYSKRNHTTPWSDILIWGTLAGGASVLIASYNLFKNWITGWPFLKSESDRLLQEINELKTSIDRIKLEQQALKEKVFDQCDSMKRLIDESREKIQTWSNSEFEARAQIDCLTESIERINRLLPQVQNSANEQLRESIKEWEGQLISLRALICSQGDDILVSSKEKESKIQDAMPLPAWQSDLSLGAIKELVL